jgi:hypothetical protein
MYNICTNNMHNVNFLSFQYLAHLYFSPISPLFYFSYTYVSPISPLFPISIGHGQGPRQHRLPPPRAQLRQPGRCHMPICHICHVIELHTNIKYVFSSIFPYDIWMDQIWTFNLVYTYGIRYVSFCSTYNVFPFYAIMAYGLSYILHLVSMTYTYIRIHLSAACKDNMYHNNRHNYTY